MTLLKADLWTLPRWFGAPVVIAAVMLGYVLSGPLTWFVVLPVAAGLSLMAYAHTMNAWLDYFWTGLDRGQPDERSRPKPYTSGQQLLASGQIKGTDVLVVAGFWLSLSLLLLAFVGRQYGFWELAVWVAIVPMTFWYSWAKLHGHPEIPLGLGFGTLAALMGAFATPHPAVWHAILGSLPIVIIFGFAAEAFDQWWDAPANFDRGAWSVGIWVWRYNRSINRVMIFYAHATIVVQLGLIVAHVLSLWTLPAIGFLAMLVLGAEAEKRNPRAVLLLLMGLCFYCLALLIGQAVVGGGR